MSLIEILGRSDAGKVVYQNFLQRVFLYFPKVILVDLIGYADTGFFQN
jgi:hypothetical protein